MIPPLALPNALSSVSLLRCDGQGNLSLPAVPALLEASVAPAASSRRGQGRGRHLDVLA